MSSIKVREKRLSMPKARVATMTAIAAIEKASMSRCPYLVDGYVGFVCEGGGIDIDGRPRVIRVLKRRPSDVRNEDQ
jgi:hypothetical protein